MVRSERHRWSTWEDQPVTRAVERPLRRTSARVRSLVQSAMLRHEEHGVDIHATAIAGVDVMCVGSPTGLMGNGRGRLRRRRHHGGCEGNRG